MFIITNAVDWPEVLNEIHIKIPAKQLRNNIVISLNVALTNYKKNLFNWRASK